MTRRVRAAIHDEHSFSSRFETLLRLRRANKIIQLPALLKLPGSAELSEVLVD